MTSVANFTPKSAILSFVITHELLTLRLFLDSLANKYFRMKNVGFPTFLIFIGKRIHLHTSLDGSFMYIFNFWQR